MADFKICACGGGVRVRQKGGTETYMYTNDSIQKLTAIYGHRQGERKSDERGPRVHTRVRLTSSG